MAYDIYGERLTPGHCEVHPWVHESYPCCECMSQSRAEQHYREAEKEYLAALEQEYQAYCEAAEEEYLCDMAFQYFAEQDAGLERGGE